MARVFLTDFGLAKDVAGQAAGLSRSVTRITATGATLGTPAYMSPEQVRGGQANGLSPLGPASDVWALGCVLHELLAGRQAFEGDSPAAVIGAVLTTTPPTPPHLPAPVRLLLLACLAKDARARPAHAAAVRDDAVRILDGRRPLARPPRRRGAARWIVAAAIVALSAASVPFLPRAGHPTPPTPTPPDDTRLAAQGWEVRRTEPRRAITLLTRAVAAAPTVAEHRLRLGLVQWAHEGFERARVTWAQVPPGSPAHGRAQWLTGLALLAASLGRDRHDLDQAAADAWQRAAAGRGPEADWARAGLAVLQHRPETGRPRRAAGGGWDAALMRALVESEIDRQGGNADREAAIADYDRVAAEGLPFRWIHVIRGVLRHEVGDDAGALADFDRALELDPEYTEAYMHRGAVHLLEGRRDEAARDLEAALTRRPDYPEALSNRGRLRFDAGDHPGALADWNRALELRPDYAPALNNRGNLELVAGNLDAAERDLNRALELDPDLPPALAARGRLHLLRGDAAAARRDLDAAIAANPKVELAHYYRGLLHQKAGDRDAALADYAAELAVRPSAFEALGNRGTLRMQAGDLAGATQDFEAALALRPEFWALYANLGIVHMRQEHWTQAVAAFDAFLQHEPTHAAADQVRGLRAACAARR